MHCPWCGFKAFEVWWENEDGTQNPIDGVGYCQHCEDVFKVSDVV